ncbi:MAG: hypothetical protein JNM82_03230, partial [Rhodocyclaceae bacterium]|nr:hypothetical protein [Rhodocyclaceae bacterium]
MGIMKRGHETLRKGFALLNAALACAAMALSGEVCSQTWRLTDLGDMSVLGYGYGGRINNRGEVAGTLNDEAVIFRDGVFTHLGSLANGNPYVRPFSVATAINERGQVAGFSLAADGTEHAFLYSEGGMLDLGTTPRADIGLHPVGINASRQIVGVAIGVGYEGTFVTYRDMPTIISPVLRGRTDYDLWNSPIGIDDAGRIYLNFSDPYSGLVPEVVRITGYQAESLFTIPRSGWALGVGPLGQVVGGYSDGRGGGAAYVFQEGVFTDLHTRGTAFDINSKGHVVGAGPDGGFLIKEGVTLDLDTLAGPAGTGWVLSFAVSINDRDQIVGSGTGPDGKRHSFLLTPVPEP